MTRGSSGNYLLRVLGKACEPHPGVHVVVAPTHVFSALHRLPISATLTAALTGSAVDVSGGGLVIRPNMTTDANGTIDLGHLYGVAAGMVPKAVVGAMVCAWRVSAAVITAGSWRFVQVAGMGSTICQHRPKILTAAPRSTC
ncbi:hypothetical protein Vretimale_14266 [Volvox reticuliferus]|uniref:Uncharacterized protein n=1 Tax=Volvox reticuliferus TaxID=1737510 RepID=A0A8J4GNE3_9CHLO|nr:hypothetical protein Vretifemale_15269 [Volvox reticuliferus]GIM10684.1 hypothetical protein Vretimale_14266 [Volvox reticuliferus]